jgi:short-subunit dehydrogenase
MCSTASLQGYPNGGSYCISKFGLLGLSKELREELKPFGIKVISMMPGATFTDSWAGSGLPEDRFISAEDLAELVFTTCTLKSSAVVEEIVIRPLAGDIGN